MWNNSKKSIQKKRRRNKDGHIIVLQMNEYISSEVAERLPCVLLAIVIDYMTVVIRGKRTTLPAKDNLQFVTFNSEEKLVQICGDWQKPFQQERSMVMKNLQAHHMIAKSFFCYTLASPSTTSDPSSHFLQKCTFLGEEKEEHDNEDIEAGKETKHECITLQICNMLEGTVSLLDIFGRAGWPNHNGIAQVGKDWYMNAGTHILKFDATGKQQGTILFPPLPQKRSNIFRKSHAITSDDTHVYAIFDCYVVSYDTRSPNNPRWVTDFSRIANPWFLCLSRDTADMLYVGGDDGLSSIHTVETTSGKISLSWNNTEATMEQMCMGPDMRLYVVGRMVEHMPLYVEGRMMEDDHHHRKIKIIEIFE